ncbi:MAG: flavoprotein-like protein [Linnemannia elongata]|nr:MAG: flavoprotein-like protein [Linnemannia elongata]
MAHLKIALVTCSTRNPRINPFITKYVHGILELIASEQASLEILDIADQSLPLYDEPAIPSRLPADNPTPHYQQEHTRQWSAKVHAYDAFVFVTPQYNWSIPASLKNALDYLFYEWKDKPAAIVSYGGHGGNKATEHLRGILGGLRMKAVATAPALTIRGSVFEESLAQGHITQEQVTAWREAGAEEAIRQMFEELIHMSKQRT